jgi:uncharacterized protein (DUF302 family)
MIYYFTKTLDLNYEEALENVTKELLKEGFGILTEIDVKKTLKIKLDQDFRKYKILGSCNPPFAFKALSAEDKIGLMLPCNVIVQEIEEGKTEVSAIDPLASMLAIDNPELEAVAKEVQVKLKKVIDGL